MTWWPPAESNRLSQRRPAICCDTRRLCPGRSTRSRAASYFRAGHRVPAHQLATDSNQAPRRPPPAPRRREGRPRPAQRDRRGVARVRLASRRRQPGYPSGTSLLLGGYLCVGVMSGSQCERHSAGRQADQGTSRADVRARHSTCRLGNGAHSSRWGDEVSEDDGVVPVVAGLAVEGAAAGDQP